MALNASYFAKQIAFSMQKPVSEPLVEPDAPLLPCLAPNSLRIARLGIDAPIVYTSGTNERVYQEALMNGVVHFPGTALPGQLGNAYIFGHSSDYPWKGGAYKTVFALLPSAKPDDRILITDPDGRLFTYAVRRTKVVSPKDVSVLDQQENQASMLTLQTSYPIGTALRRFIVQADLIEETRCKPAD